MGEGAEKGDGEKGAAVDMPTEVELEVARKELREVKETKEDVGSGRLECCQKRTAYGFQTCADVVCCSFQAGASRAGCFCVPLGLAMMIVESARSQHAGVTFRINDHARWT